MAITIEDNYIIIEDNDIINAVIENFGYAKATSFVTLSDTPNSFVGKAGQYTKVNTLETALEFGSPSGSGDMIKAIYDTNNNGIVDSSQYDITTIAALENIPAYSPATASGYIADSSNLGKICSGVSLTAITSGLAGNMATSGEISNIAWSWSTGDRLFLNGVIISKTAPTIGYVQQIGVAKNATTIIININNIILL